MYPVCKYFERGNCQYGKRCFNLHEKRIESGDKESSICKFYLTGNCRKGKACLYQHTIKPTLICSQYLSEKKCSNNDNCDKIHIDIENIPKLYLHDATFFSPQKAVFISKWRYRTNEDYLRTAYYYNIEEECYTSFLDRIPCASVRALPNIITFIYDYNYCYQRFKIVCALETISDIKFVIWNIFKEVINNHNLNNGFRPTVTYEFSKV
jgi:hypothetical protein